MSETPKPPHESGTTPETRTPLEILIDAQNALEGGEFGSPTTNHRVKETLASLTTFIDQYQLDTAANQAGDIPTTENKQGIQPSQPSFRAIGAVGLKRPRSRRMPGEIAAEVLIPTQTETAPRSIFDTLSNVCDIYRSMIKANIANPERNGTHLWNAPDLDTTRRGRFQSPAEIWRPTVFDNPVYSFAVDHTGDRVDSFWLCPKVIPARSGPTGTSYERIDRSLAWAVKLSYGSNGAIESIRFDCPPNSFRDPDETETKRLPPRIGQPETTPARPSLKPNNPRSPLYAIIMKPSRTCGPEQRIALEFNVPAKQFTIGCVGLDSRKATSSEIGPVGTDQAPTRFTYDQVQDFFTNTPGVKKGQKTEGKSPLELESTMCEEVAREIMSFIPYPAELGQDFLQRAWE